MISYFFMSFGNSSINPLIATYMKYLGAGAQMTGFLAGLFFFVAFAVHPFAGPVITRLDKRKLLIVVFIIGAVANLGYALFRSIPMFVAFRFLSGIQFSAIGPLLLALCGDHLPKNRLAYGLGVYGIGGATANAVSPSIGSAVLKLGTSLRGESFGFTLMFLFGSVILGIAIIPASLIEPDKKTKEEIASTGAWYKNMVSLNTLPLAIVLMMLMMAYSIIQTYMFEFAKERGFEGVGIFFLVLASMLAVTRPMSGFLTDRLGVKKVVFPSIVIFALSFFVIGSSGALWMALIGAVVFSIGFGSTHPTLQAMSMQTEPALRRGVATNTVYMCMDLGLFLGPLFGGFVYANTNYSFMFKTSVAPIAIALVCIIIYLPAYERRLKKLENTASDDGV